MHYTVDFLPKFAQEFENLPVEHQNKVLDFVMTFQQFGLRDFSRYEGKIAKSWVEGDSGSKNYYYARGNHLWHYHIGLPEYVHRHDKYLTSDIVLHFQWPLWAERGNHICLVDMYDHYTSSGEFYLPSEQYLKR